MLLIAIANGMLREAVIKRYVSDAVAHRLSTVSLLIFFSAYIWYIIKSYPPASGQQAWLVGLLWVVLTLAFEFGFGLYRGNSLSVLLNEYNLLEGKMWVLIPLWVGISPYLFFRLQHP